MKADSTKDCDQIEPQAPPSSLSMVIMSCLGASSWSSSEPWRGGWALPASSFSLPVAPFIVLSAPQIPYPNFLSLANTTTFAASSSGNNFSLEDTLPGGVWMMRRKMRTKSLGTAVSSTYFCKNQGSWLIVTTVCAWTARTAVLLAHSLLGCECPSQVSVTEKQQGLGQKPPMKSQDNNGLPWASWSSDSWFALARCERPHPSRSLWMITQKQR